MSLAASARCRQQPRANPFAGNAGEWVLAKKAGRVYVRSSYEKRVLQALDVHPEVVDVKVEPLAILYEYDGVLRHYVPDFLVTLTGNIRELWEVKPERFLTEPQNIAKFAALNEYVSMHGMNACILTLATIEKMERALAVQEALCP